MSSKPRIPNQYSLPFLTATIKRLVQSNMMARNMIAETQKQISYIMSSITDEETKARTSNPRDAHYPLIAVAMRERMVRMEDTLAQLQSKYEENEYELKALVDYKTKLYGDEIYEPPVKRSHQPQPVVMFGHAYSLSQ